MDYMKSNIQGIYFGFVQEQDREAVLRTAETLKGELESLQLLNERLNGESLDGLSYPELWSLEKQLAQGMVTVERQAVKAEMELIAKQEADPDYTGLEWGDEKRFESEFVLLRRRKNLRNQARELRISSSSGERQEEHDREALLQNIEHMKSEIERLRLLNE
ncbi:PREDICTED: agamous-like MADS-box protein AGL18 [Camelina sativa]|uniref:Agamous-like MADS-box protein AGL18 n=1 Tax=Camelina sativa TaxID=90675 RepID=A0ABM1RNZ4_CAMSA|nr:PREDICTED: agamous-like MADS-box protein AGL18 [Camelina sativa]